MAYQGERYRYKPYAGSFDKAEVMTVHRVMTSALSNSAGLMVGSTAQNSSTQTTSLISGNWPQTPLTY